ncbi:unnamed protein product [Oppiella nova]|uniref:Uncharacterized protein n=1 Tax=Oppiella nova TaxID=334625 RepID=A0A7R9LIH5_9ACAR|nr:unnamed protein product [Oppiella nova]CAG2163577.1 unnamed protein product [Oppiella nova]
MVLAASSSYFENLFISNPCTHPIIILKDVSFSDLQSVIDFIYTGEVNVPQDQLSSLLKTAETLRIKGLTEVADKESRSEHSVQSMATRTRRRKRKRNKSQNNENNSRLECAIDGSLATPDHQLELEDGEDNGYTIDNHLRVGLNNNCSTPQTIEVNYSNNCNVRGERQKMTTNIDTITVNKDKELTLNLEDIEPTTLLEQSMSTPENSRLECAIDGSLATPDHQLELEDGEDNGYTIDNHLRVGLNNNCSTPQTIEEYEQLLSQIQSKNLTTCPVCSKAFIKKSKLIRHYHTHFSNFRPKFSCGCCGKLFTTQDWCKRHALNCQSKVSAVGFV